MFVQSHIQRHHNNHNNHSHGHNHHSQRNQQHSSHHNKQHHNSILVASVAHSRAVAPSSTRSLTRESNTQAFGTNELVFSSTSHQQKLIVSQQSDPTPTRYNLHHHHHHQQQQQDDNSRLFGEHERSGPTNRQTTKRTRNRSDSWLANSSSFDSNDGGDGKRLKNDDWSADASGRETTTSGQRRHSLRAERSKSLGSHESLRVYDFMPRNTAPSGTTTSYCEPSRCSFTTTTTTELVGSNKSTALRLTRTLLSVDSCAEARRANSDEGPERENGTSLRKFFAGSQQLLSIILDTPWLLAGKLSSAIERSQGVQPLTLLTTTINDNPQGSNSWRLVRSFCMSFVAYQLETWCILAHDLAREKQFSSSMNKAVTSLTRQNTLHRGEDAAWKRATYQDEELVRAATATGRPQHTNPLRGRKFLSLDRPILERQREVVFDEDAGEPCIRIPKILREPPLQSAPTIRQKLHHQHRHNHRHEGCHSAQVEPLHVGPVAQSPVPPVVAYAANLDQHVEPARYQKSYHQAAEQSFSEQQKMANGRMQPHRKATFYLGQRSLDCDYLQAASSLGATRPNRGEALLEVREDLRGNNFVSQNYYNKEEYWADRPFCDGDFRSTPRSQQAKSEDGTTGGSNNNANSDHHDGIQQNTSLLNEPLSAQKRRSLKKSSSPLSFEGARRRLGLKRKDEANLLSSISVNRSEEVIPTQVRHLSRQTTFNSLYDSGNESGSFWRAQTQISDDPRASFVDGFGSGQIASRQALVSPYLGDIQLSLSSRRSMLEVEVIRARRLHAKAGTKSLPSPYVKVYLMKGKKCIAKCRTRQISQTLDPLYQEPFVFRNEFKNCVLQVIVWGDYGKRDRKSMMGIVQIHLDELDISNVVIDWYKLFNVPSMTNSQASSKILRQKLLHSSSISESRINS